MKSKIKLSLTLEKAREVLKILDNQSISNNEYFDNFKIIEKDIIDWINDKVKNDSNYWKEYCPKNGDVLIFEDSNSKSEKLWIYILKSKNGEENDAAGNKKLTRVLTLSEIYMD